MNVATLRFLIDTNVVIPLEPASTADLGQMSPLVIEFKRECDRAGVTLFLHPASRYDIARDTDSDRRRLREVLFGKYQHLEDPPPVSSSTNSVLQDAAIGSNDWVDNCLIEAIRSSCAHFLVTEDRDIHKKSRRLGLGDKVVLIREALAIVRRLFDQPIDPPPAVENVLVYSLDRSDPIFQSFREDYSSFDVWLWNCGLEHRRAWVIRRNNAIAAFIIFKSENGAEIGVDGKLLKLCSFKVAETFRGLAYGELLLRSAYSYAKRNGFSWIYLTAFAEKQPYLIDFLEDHGFAVTGQKTRLGEDILSKPAGWRQGLKRFQDPSAFLRRYGPFSFDKDQVSGFIVPIRPEYHSILFPDASAQGDLFEGQNYFGNAIRKAYLCNAAVRRVSPGDLLLFYQSQGDGRIQAVGVVEKVLVSGSATDVASFVGKRTVYSFQEIEALAEGREVLALLFMAVKVTGENVALTELVEKGIVSAAPQSIQSISKEGVSWLLGRLQL